VICASEDEGAAEDKKGGMPARRSSKLMEFIYNGTGGVFGFKEDDAEAKAFNMTAGKGGKAHSPGDQFLRE